MRRQRNLLAALSLAVLACAPHIAGAAVPEPTPEELQKAASKDTSRFLPQWLHLHAAVGLGWLASPEWLRKFYQAGQSYELGFEVRPGSTLKLRLTGDYQVLPAVTRAKFTFITSVPGLDGTPLRDSLQVETRANGWIGSGRLEAQWGLTPHLWLLGGFGPGYLNTGLESFHERDDFSSLDFEFPGRSGWTWIGTAGASYEFEAFGPRLSAELRTGYIMRELDRMQTWSIRLGWGGH